jgi:hypothetical protein
MSVAGFCRVCGQYVWLNEGSVRFCRRAVPAAA